MKLRVIAITLIIMIGLMSIRLFERDGMFVQASSDEQLICQTYRVKPEIQSVVFRSCSSLSCNAVGGAAQQDVICVRGVAKDNPNFLVVDPDPANENVSDAYVVADLLEPGGPEGTQQNANTDPNYCNAFSPSLPLIIRSGPSPDEPAIGELSPDDVACVEQYNGGFIYWLGIAGNGWIKAEEVTYFYDEAITCESYRVVQPEATVRSCPSFTCDRVQTLTQGDNVCIDRESGENLEWLGFNYNGRTGWVYAPFIRDVDDPDIITLDLDPIGKGIAVANVNLRAGDTIGYPVLFGVNAQSEVNIFGVSSKGWYYVQTEDGYLGWLSPPSVEVDLSDIVLPLIRLYSVEVSAPPNVDINEIDESPASQVIQLEPDLYVAPVFQAPVFPTDVSTVDVYNPDLCRFHTVSGARINVRREPTVVGEVLSVADEGQRVCVVLDAPNTENWYFIRFINPTNNSISGYVSSSLLTAEPGQALVLDETVNASVFIVGQTETIPQSVSQVLTPVSITTTESPATGSSGVLQPIIEPSAVLPVDETAVSQLVQNNGGQILGAATPTPSFPIIQSGAVSPTPQLGLCSTTQITNCVTPTPSASDLFEPQPTQVRALLLAQDLRFDQLRFRDVTLRSPQSSSTYNFNLPRDWSMDGSSVLFLNIEYNEDSAPSTTSESITINENLTSRLEVSLDSELVSVFNLTNENNAQRQTLEIPLPADLLRRGEFHQIQIQFLAEEHCLADKDSSVTTISSGSGIHFEYREELPSIDFRLYPRPFYNDRPITENESVILVLPDNLNDDILEAAASISGGLGALTRNALEIRVRRVSQLTDFERDTSNLILLGKPDDNILIKQYYERDLFPTSLKANGISLDNTTFGLDDGIVQLIRHPDSETNAIMAVTALTDVGLKKGALAIAGPPSVLSLNGPLIVVKDTQPIRRGAVTENLNNIIRLQNLGQQEDLILQGLGQSRLDVDFTIPVGTELAEDAYVDVYFNFSKLLENVGSSFTVMINETPITSIVLSELSDNSNVSEIGAQGIHRLRAPITSSLVNPGRANSLAFVLDATAPIFECNTPDGNVLWFTISNQSLLNLPQRLSTESSVSNFVGLFPQPFAQLNNLSDLWINLPSEPTDLQLENVMRLVSMISSGTLNAEGIAPRINRGLLPPDLDMENYNFLLIGRPSTNPLIEEIGPFLPQPFAPGSDEIEQRLDDVSIQLPPGLEIGIMQRIDSPWTPGNPFRKVMVISGTGQNGENDAMRILTSESFIPEDMAGDVVFVYGEDMSYVNSVEVLDNFEIMDGVPLLLTQQFKIQETVTMEAQLRATQDAMQNGTVALPFITPTPPLITPIPSNPLLPELPETPYITVIPEDVEPTRTIVPIFSSDNTNSAQSAVLPTSVADAAPVNTQDEFNSIAQPTLPPRPVFVDILILVTGVIMGIMGIGVLIRFVINTRRRRSNTVR